MLMTNRRQLLYGSSAVLGFPVLSTLFAESSSAQTVSSPSTTPCPALATYLGERGSELIRAFHSQTVTGQHFRNSANAATLLARHLEASGFEKALKPLVANMTMADIVPPSSNSFDSAAAAINGSNPIVTSDMLSKLMPYSTLSAQNALTYTQKHGISGYLRNSARMMHSMADVVDYEQAQGTWTSISPVDFHSEESHAHLRRICSSTPPSHKISPELCGFLFDSAGITLNAILAALLLEENAAALAAVLAALGFLTITGLIIFVAGLTIGLLALKLGC